MNKKDLIYRLLMLCLPLMFFFNACSKSPINKILTTKSSGSDTTPIVVPDSVKFEKYLVKTGTINLQYADTAITFTAPQDSITYYYYYSGGYYSFIVASNKTSIFQVSLGSYKPELLTINDYPFPCELANFYTTYDYEGVLYTNFWDEYLEGISGADNRSTISSFNNNNVLIKATFLITLTRGLTLNTYVNIKGNIDLNLNK